jgi:hypothetical protein
MYLSTTVCFTTTMYISISLYSKVYVQYKFFLIIYLSVSMKLSLTVYFVYFSTTMYLSATVDLYLALFIFVWYYLSAHRTMYIFTTICSSTIMYLYVTTHLSVSTHHSSTV